jgi:hypothetical protein
MYSDHSDATLVKIKMTFGKAESWARIRIWMTDGKKQVFVDELE